MWLWPVDCPTKGCARTTDTRPVSSQLFYTTSIGSMPRRGEFRATVAHASRRRHCAQPPPPFQPLPAPARGRPPPLSFVLLLIVLDTRVGVRCVASTSRTPASHHPLQRRVSFSFLFFFFFSFFFFLSLAFQGGQLRFSHGAGVCGPVGVLGGGCASAGRGGGCA